MNRINRPPGKDFPERNFLREKPPGMDQPLRVHLGTSGVLGSDAQLQRKHSRRNGQRCREISRGKRIPHRNLHEEGREEEHGETRESID